MDININIFRRMILIHGADLERWDGFNADAVRTFIKSSDEAGALYEEAQKLDAALDRYDVEDASPALLDGVMNRDEPQILDNPDNIVSPAFIARKPVWAGLTALAAAVILFVAVIPQMSAPGAGGTEGKIEVFLAEILPPEEDIMSFFEMAQAEPMRDKDIEDFIDRLLEDEILEEGDLDQFFEPEMEKL